VHIAVETNPIVEPIADGVGAALFTSRFNTLSQRIDDVSELGIEITYPYAKQATLEKAMTTAMAIQSAGLVAPGFDVAFATMCNRGIDKKAQK